MRGFFLKRLPTCKFLWLATLMLSVLPMLGVADEHQDVHDDAHKDANEAWARVLVGFVDDSGRTDFRRLAAMPQDLDIVVAHVANHGPDSEPDRYSTKEQILAFHINAYNALAMHGVIDAGIPKGFNSILKRARFFKFRKVSVDGKRMSLSAYENDVIRPLGEPRVHYALNCMVKDCPRLPREPFTAETLDKQLEGASIEFFNDLKHLMRLPEKEQVAVSKILDFYTKDFAASGRRQDLIPYINQFLEVPIPASWALKFMDYDWTINQQP